MWRSAARKELWHIKFSRGMDSYGLRMLNKKLNELRRRNVDALALSFQAGAGSFVESKLAIEAIRSFSSEKMVPIYTFAEDFALDTGYMMLAAGHEVAANPFSIVGDVGRTVKALSVEKLVKKLGFKSQTFTADPTHTNPYKVWKQRSPAELAFLQGQLEAEQAEFEKFVLEQRGLAFEKAVDLGALLRT